MTMGRTRRAVAGQLAAMGQDRYQVGIRDDAGCWMTRTWSEDQILRSLGWLRHKNAGGEDIYIRPAPETDHDLVLLDDLDEDALDALEADGLRPAVIVETSPSNWQAWIKLPSREPSAVRTEISRQLARTYGADRGAVGADRYGRLAGFTNKKPVHERRTGRSPFVLLREADGGIAEGGSRIIMDARTRLTARQAEQRRQTPASPCGDAEAAFAAILANLHDPDPSRVDFTIGLILARRGYNSEQIGAVIEAVSPALDDRKAGHVQDYVQRTVKAIMDALDEPPGPPAPEGNGPGL